jgi:hypothetical protein
MKLIDVLNKVEKREEGSFKFYVNYGPIASEIRAINWIYDNGEITTKDDSDNIFYFLRNDTYSLSDEIVIIEEPLDNWEELRRMIEKTIVALNENTKDPTDEFITTIVGTFGRVLNIMDELEGKEDKDGNK